MANDVYVKFGQGTDVGGPLNTPLPDIEGDSTDEVHYWWCELRECGFDMETPQQEDSANGDSSTGNASGGSSSSDSKKPASGFKAVRLTKRVDWASTQLFLKCCQAAMATTTKSTDDKGNGRIDMVTVEVCRPVSGQYFYKLDNGSMVPSLKVPCATVKYRGVRIIRYELTINTPEPAEVITFEFDDMQFQYLRTNPETGEVVDDKGQRTGWLENHHPEAQASGDSSSSSSASAPADTGGSGGGGAAGSPAAPPIAPTSSSGANAAPGDAPDPTVNVNFPGLWQGTGFGLLPD